MWDLGVSLSSCSWFRLRPEGGASLQQAKGVPVGDPGSEWVRSPQFVANVPVGGRPTFILGFVYVAALPTARRDGIKVEMIERS